MHTLEEGLCEEGCSVEKPSAGDAGRGASLGPWPRDPSPRDPERERGARRKRWGMGGETVAGHGTPAAEDVGLARGRPRCRELFDRAMTANSEGLRCLMHH